MRAKAALVEALHDLAGGELLARVHAHVQRSVVGVGEAALARVDLHRGGAEVEVDRVCADSLPHQHLQPLGVAGADEPHIAGDLGRKLNEPLLGKRVAVDRDQRAGRAQALRHQARVAAAAEGAVHRGRTRGEVEQLGQLVREHGDVSAVAAATGLLRCALAGPMTRGPAASAMGAPHVWHLTQDGRHQR